MSLIIEHSAEDYRAFANSARFAFATLPMLASELDYSAASFPGPIPLHREDGGRAVEAQAGV